MSGTGDTEAVMKFLFDDESFSFETLRTAGFAMYGGSDLGEVLVTANAITGGDEASWHLAWKATAERVAEIGERSLAAGHRIRRGRSAEGAGEHTHADALGRAHQVMFDWPDTTLPALTRVPQRAHR